MKLFNYLRLSFAALAALAAVSCTDPNGGKEDEEIVNKDVTFYVKIESVTATTADLTMFHNGDDTHTWYGFLSANTEASDAKLIGEAVTELMKGGLETNLKTGKKTTINLTGLTESTKYKYIVFGIDKKGEVYGKSSTCEIETAEGAFVKVDAWGASFSKFNIVEASNGVKYDCITLNITEKEQVSDYFYPFVMGIGNYDYYVSEEMGMTEADIAAAIGADYQAMFEYYLKDQKIPMSEITLTESGEYHEPRYSDMGIYYSGDYYVFVLGFDKNGKPDKKFSVVKVTVPQDSARPEYEKWIGDWNVSDGTNTYAIKIEAFDNNLAYAISGWETGSNADKDDLNRLVQAGEQLKFEANFIANDGSIVIHNQPYGLLEGNILFGLYGFFEITDDKGGKIVEYAYGDQLSTNRVARATMNNDNKSAKLFNEPGVVIYVYDETGKYIGDYPVNYTHFQFAGIEIENNWTYKTYNTNVPKMPATFTKIESTPSAAQASAAAVAPIKKQTLNKDSFLAPAFVANGSTAHHKFAKTQK